MSLVLGKLVSYLNTYLDVGAYKESAINGLQVSGKKEIRKIAFAVDGVLETFEKAAAAGADMMIVHHGIYWGHQWALRGANYKRIKILMDHEMALYAAHLPLDAHGEVGHNVQLLKALGAKPEDLEPFGNYKGTTIGWQARIAETTRDQLTERLEGVLGGSVKLLGFGPEKIKSIACITGAGADFGSVGEAKIKNIHYFISGEAQHPLYHFARESSVNVALGGHYHTEVFGLHALAKHLEENFEVETFFIDCPTGM